MSTIQASNISDGTSTVGTEYVINGSAKSWVNFDGTGTVSIRESFNVSSITDNGTGDYTVNFTTSLKDENYSVLGGVKFPHNNNRGGGFVNVYDTASAMQTNSVRLSVAFGSTDTNDGGAFDSIAVFASIIR